MHKPWNRSREETPRSVPTITTLEAQQASDFAGEKLGLLVRYTAASCSSQAAASATRRDGFARVTDRPPSAIATLSCIVPGVRKAMVCHSRPVMIIARDGERLRSPLDDPDSSSVYVRPAGPASNRPGPRDDQQIDRSAVHPTLARTFVGRDQSGMPSCAPSPGSRSSSSRWSPGTTW
jgi:hypothetical protein